MFNVYCGNALNYSEKILPHTKGNKIIKKLQKSANASAAFEKAVFHEFKFMCDDVKIMINSTQIINIPYILLTTMNHKRNGLQIIQNKLRQKSVSHKLLYVHEAVDETYVNAQFTIVFKKKKKQLTLGKEF